MHHVLYHVLPSVGKGWTLGRAAAGARPPRLTQQSCCRGGVGATHVFGGDARCRQGPLSGSAMALILKHANKFSAVRKGSSQGCGEVSKQTWKCMVGD